MKNGDGMMELEAKTRIQEILPIVSTELHRWKQASM